MPDAIKKRPDDARLPIVSLFTGAGGLDYAFERTGKFRTVLAVEHQPEFCETLKAAVAEGSLKIETLLQADIHALDPLVCLKEFRRENKKLAGIIGGPPCEAFSTMGRKRGMNDSRGLLVYEYLRFVEALRPHFFLIENVRGFGTMHNGQVIRDIGKRMSTLGYSVVHQVLCAADFGAATVRKRLFIVGLLGDRDFEFPARTHSSPNQSDCHETKTWVPSSEVLGDLPPPSRTPPGSPPGHVTIDHSPEVRLRFAQTPPGGYDYVRKRSRLHWDRPSPSLVAGDLRQTRSLIHPMEPRELTNLECSRIQGFPDHYPFAGNKSLVAKQITNSVPIELGSAIALALVRHLLSGGRSARAGILG